MYTHLDFSLFKRGVKMSHTYRFMLAPQGTDIFLATVYSWDMRIRTPPKGLIILYRQDRSVSDRQTTNSTPLLSGYRKDDFII